MVKQTIQIFARVKPTSRKQPQGIYSVDEDEKSVAALEIILPRDLAEGFVNNKRESYKFKFQRIFDQESKQEDIFDIIAKPVAESVLSGYNGTIFAYGQTGSGKTFTITGGAERYSDRGIIPRTLSYIFEQLQKDSRKMYTTHISYLEIYNECGYDLLDPRHEASSLEDLPKVTILEDPDQNIHLKNLSLQQATTEEEALNLLFLGDTNRMIAEESISTCRFAQRVALIKNEAVLNEEIDPRLTIIRLKKEIQELKDELAIVTGEQRTEELTQVELDKLEEQIRSFLEDQDPESRLEVGSDMRKIHHCFHYLKKLLSERKIPEKSEPSPEIKDQDGEVPLKEEEFKKLRDILKQRDNEINILVNMLKKEKKKVQDMFNQQNTSRGGTRQSLSASPLSGGLDDSSKVSISSTSKLIRDGNSLDYRSAFHRRKTGKKEEMSLGRQEAFEIFKQDHADSITIEDNKQILRQRFSEAKALGESINEVRSKIGHLKEEINQRQMQRVALSITDNAVGDQELDPVEEKLRSKMEEEKKSYKKMFTHLKGLKVEIEHLQLLMEKAKVKLKKEFEVWWIEEAINLQKKSLPANSLRTPESRHQQQSQSHLANKSELISRKIMPSPPPPSRNQRSRCSNSSVEESDLISKKNPPPSPLPSRSFENKFNNPNVEESDLTPRSKVPSPPPPSRNQTYPPDSLYLEERVLGSPSPSIPFTGDSQTDNDILAFLKARQSLLQKKGLANN
ncbi:kinesin-like protein KIF6 isoform X2 [Vombatus ursinus]|uniref:kinesin-like protein KIF6 isoform X2 n=1 Tax=Vombatus ursinus TaxID=29139 RepID=UPI000FFDAFA3|nr:kinesin-like protein KIF6 isoform X2 [Vombatus ursinus]XP_027732379.1 kinesin-like protein KIF6 isoform X2 [Vombatus ursinus]